MPSRTSFLVPGLHQKIVRRLWTNSLVSQWDKGVMCTLSLGNRPALLHTNSLVLRQEEGLLRTIPFYCAHKFRIVPTEPPYPQITHTHYTVHYKGNLHILLTSGCTAQTALTLLLKHTVEMGWDQFVQRDVQSLTLKKVHRIKTIGCCTMIETFTNY